MTNAAPDIPAPRPSRSGSIRGRLQWWYGLVFALSLIAFGCLVYWRADREMRERAVQQAVSAVQYLDVSLRNLPHQLINDPGAWESDQGRFADGNRFPRSPLGPLPPDVTFRPPRRDGSLRNDPPNGRPESPSQPGDPIPDPSQSNPGRPKRPPQNRGRQDRQPPRFGGPPSGGPPSGGPRSGGPRSGGPPIGGPGFDGPPFNGRDRGRPPRMDSAAARSEDRRRLFERRPLDHTEFVVWRADGTVFQTSDGQSGATLPQSKPDSPPDNEPRIQLNRDQVTATLRGPYETTILALRPMRNDLANLQRFGLQIIGIGITTLVIGLVGGWWMSGRIVRPIAMISNTAATISAARLDARIETAKLDRELIQLGTVLNDTFARLEQSFGRLTQFTADASHELRTPLAVIQSQIELTLSQARTSSEYQQTLSTCLRSAARMQSLVDGLLLLARTDADRMELRQMPLDLRTLAEDAVAQLQEKATAARVNLECLSPDEAVVVLGDPTFLVRVPANLIDNAIQHSPAGGTVRIEIRTDGHEAVLEVTDSGNGIPVEHLPHVFERFYRIDTARSRANGGSGLGLAICQSLVVGHGGSIQCQSNSDSGAVFTVRLPLSGADPSKDNEPCAS